MYHAIPFRFFHWSLILLLFSGLACAQSNAQSIPQTREAYKSGAFRAQDLLWYDGTHIGEALREEPLKKIRSVQASSTLGDASGQQRYDIQRAFDRNLKTAWCEGADGQGIGESITIRFAEEVIPSGMLIVPGHGFSRDIWQKNQRILQFRLRFLKTPAIKAELAAAGEALDEREYLAELKQEGGSIPFGRAQYYDFRPGFTQDMSVMDYDGVRFEITAVESDGAKYDDAWIAELRFFSWE